MLIQPMTDELVPAAQALVDRAFPVQGPIEHRFFWAYQHRGSALSRLYMRAARLAELTEFWVAVDDRGAVIGTTGLYRYRKDADEAVWLSWFCVDRRVRGAGVGGRLLDFSIERARAHHADFLRLYTSDDANEAVAQRLYESRGLEVYETRKRIFYRLIRRQLALSRPGDPGTVRAGSRAIASGGGTVD